MTPANCQVNTVSAALSGNIVNTVFAAFNLCHTVGDKFYSSDGR